MRISSMCDRARSKRALLFPMLLASVLFLAWPSGGYAAHDLGQNCYNCHNIEGGQVWAGSYSIWSGKAIGMSPYSRPITCDVCHTDYGNRFKATSASHHPVAVIAGATMNSSYDNGVQVLCRDCHNGNSVTSLTPDLTPDLVPRNYVNIAGNDNLDGYPNHDISVPNNQVSPGDPPHLLSMILSAGQRTLNGSDVYNKIPSASPATDYAFCFSCHDGSANTARAVNVKQDYVDKGHYFKTTGGGITAGDRIPCSDCHASHNSPTNARLFEPDNTTWTGARPSGLTFVSPYAPDNTEYRALCIFCHEDYNSTNTVNTAKRVRGVAPSPRLYGVPGHAGTDTPSCKLCHNPHKPPGGGPDCLTCHTIGGGGGTKDYIDALFKGVGSDNGVAKPAASGALNWSQHGGFTGNASNFLYLSPYNTKATNDCFKCHGDRHSNTYKLIDADNTDSYAYNPAVGMQDNTAAGITNANAFCLTCHDGNGAASDVQIGGQVPPNVAANYAATGHGRPQASGQYSVSLNNPAYLKCTDCHEVHGSNHAKLLPAKKNETNGNFTIPSNFPEKTFRSGGSTLLASDIDFTDYSSPASGKGFGTTGDPGDQRAPAGASWGLCDACHRYAGRANRGTDNVTNRAHTHEGMTTDNNQDVSSQMNFAKDCLECHDTHGTTNLEMVNTTINGVTPVTFTARTVANSFDPLEGGSTANVNSVCVVCHQNSTENATLNVSHNFRSSTVNPDHNEDSNCASCHPHGTSNAKKFGFAQASCSSCHGSGSTGMPAPGDGGTYHPDANNVIGTRGSDNTAHKIHVNYLANKRGVAAGSTCHVCHKGGGSQESGHPANPTNKNFKSGAQPTAVPYLQVAMDNGGTGSILNVWNGVGTGPIYSGTPGQPADAANGWKTCSNTKCHYALSPSWSGKQQVGGTAFPATTYIATIDSGTSLGWGATNMTSGAGKTSQNDNTLLVLSGETLEATYYGAADTTERTAYNAVWNTALAAGSNTTITGVSFSIYLQKANAADRVRLRLQYFNPSGGAATTLYDTGLVDPGGQVGSTALFTHASPTFSAAVPDGMKLGVKVGFQQGSASPMRVYVATGTAGQNSRITISGANSTGVAPAPPRSTGDTTAIACNTCHQFGPDDTTAGYKDDNQYYYDLPGSHVKHGVSVIAGNDPAAGDALDTCTICHPASSNTYDSDHMDGVVDIRSGSIGTRVGGAGYADTGTYVTGTRACSSNYCHGGAGSWSESQEPNTGIPRVYPRWGVPSTVNDCGDCHWDQGAAASVPYYYRNSEIHHPHSFYNKIRIGCEVCHARNASSHPNTTHGGGDDNPLTPRTVEVKFTDNPSGVTYGGNPFLSRNMWTNPYTGSGVTPSYAEGPYIAYDNDLHNERISWTQGTCSNVWCHSNANPVGGTNAYRSATWDQKNCYFCHNDPMGNRADLALCSHCHRGAATAAAMAGTDNLSVTHIRHVATDRYAFGCNQCHAGTVTGTLDNTVNVNDNHVNGVKDVRFSTVRATTINQSSGTYGNPTRECGNTYCHSDGSSIKNGGAIQPNTIRWDNTTSPLPCNSCHGIGGPVSGSPNYATSGTRRNSHPAHVSFGCQTCHGQTTTTGNTITNAANHVNGSYEVSGTGFAYVYDGVNGSTCAFTSGCHGTGTVRWGTATSGFCFTCHQGTEGTNKPQGAADNNANAMDNTQYFQSGHGRTGSNYPVSGNPPAGKWNAGTGGGCYTSDPEAGCHASTAAHVPASASDPYRLGATYADNTTALCLTCHGAAGPAATRNMQEHSKAMTGSSKAWPGSDYPWKCVDCHDPHGDGTDASLRITMVRSAINNPTGTDNANVGSNGKGSPMRPPGWTAISFTDNTGFAAGSYAQPGAGTWGICEGCHRNTSAFSQTLDNVSTHGTRTGRCTTCHSHSGGFRASCNTCHGDVGGAIRGDSTDFPPQGPQTGTGGWAGRSWAERQATPASRGDHLRHAGSAYFGKTCTACHTTQPGSDASHATDKTNATMTGMSTYGTWSAGTMAGSDNVTDDSCATVSCHSPYSGENPSNVYRSGTPFTTGTNAYTRYWIDSVSSDCYTCHGYDGVTATTRPAGRTGIATGSHAMHISWNYHYMECYHCHPDHVGNNDHKSGSVDWSFTGSPNPYGASPSTSVSSGTQMPTDGNTGAGHRAYTTCSNVYCHSTAQTSPPGGAPTYRTPRWDNSSTGVCGTCHDVGWRTIGGMHGNHTNDGGPQISTGSHLAHVGSTSYAVSCDTCHGVGPGTGGGSGCSSGCHFTLSPTHADGQVSVLMGRTWATSGRSIVLTDNLTIFDSTGTHGSGTDDKFAVVGADSVYGACWGGPNLYCHSDGAGGAPLVNPARWGDTSVRRTDCTYCHGGKLSSSATVASGSHTAHIASYQCSACHRGTMTAGSDNVIAVFDNHVNGTRNILAGDGYTFTYTAGSPSTCSAISCHGGSGATWGGSGSCAGCHVGTGDLDDFGTGSAASIYSNGITARIDNTEWMYSGHGKSSGTYDVSGHAAANFGRNANPNPCAYCHDSTVAHNTTSNPFRLVNQTGKTGFGADGWNATCLVCHSKSTPVPPGYDPDNTGTTYVSINSTDNGTRVDTAHYGSKHSSGKNGGTICWNCHDAHGDRVSGSGNIFMIGKKVTKQSDNVLGIPVGGNDNSNRVTPTFTAATTGTDYAKATPGPYTGICQVCHDATVSHYTSTSGDTHNSTTRCTNCHSHDANFAPVCTACHGGGLSGEGFQNWWPDSVSPNGTRWPNRNGGATTHTRHITRIAEVVNATATPTTAQKNATCDGCHPTGQHTGDQASPPADLMDGATYKFKNIAGATNLRTTTVTQGPGTDNVWDNPGFPNDEVTCSNVDCHYTRNMGAADWYSPSLQSNTCSYCHVADNTSYVAGDLPNAHDNHVGVYKFICGWCHPIWGGTFNHQDGKVSLGWGYNPGPEAGDRFATGGTGVPKFGGGTAGDYATCGGLTCHGDWNDPGIAFKGGNNYSPNWFKTAVRVGTDNSDGRCGTCHGDPLAAGAGTNKAWPRSGSNSESHGEHIASNASPTCSACHYDPLGTNGTYGNPATHSNRALTPIDIDNTYNFESATATFEGAGNTCANVRCHNGTTTPNFTLSGGTNITCGVCHNGGAGAADPRPSGDNVSKSHPAHADNNAVYTDCDNCHGNATYNVSGSRGGSGYTATGGGGASPNGVHQNLIVNMYMNGGSGSYTDTDNTAGGVNWNSAGATHVDDGTCSTACHGAGTPTWGGTLSGGCGACHIGTGDLDDFGTGTAASIYGNGITARIDNTEWFWSGHGKSSGTYDVSGHAAANFGRNANPNPCAYCHDSTVAHNTTSNPFRLVDQTGKTGFGADGWNATCLVCHSKSTPVPPGYDPDNTGTTYVSINSTDNGTRVDTAHYGSKHSSGKNGGTICWNCHDAHGDRVSGSGNIFMVGKKVTKQSDNVLGIPAGGNDNSNRVTPTFTAASTGTDYAKATPGPYTGICQVCHDATVSHYTATSGDTHNSTARCTSCHPHNGHFEANCSDCHDNNGAKLIPAPIVVWSGGGRTSPPGVTAGTYGSHLVGLKTDTINTSTNWNVQCNKCHNGHGGTVQVPMPPTSWTDPSGRLTGTNMAQRLGLDNYAVDNGIRLGGTATSGTTEADVCWNCHVNAVNNVSEWGFNTKTTPTGFPVVLDTTPGNFPTQHDGTADRVNNGWIWNSSSYVTKTTDWTAGYWMNEYDNALKSRVTSVHSTSFDPSGQSSSVSNNVNGSGVVNKSTPVLENKSFIRCSYCHDVHDLNRAQSDSTTGKPFLRGTWVGDPYPPELPPRSTYSYPTGAPRNVSTNRQRGGYFIDQNSNWPTNNASMNTPALTAGLCTLCHGSNVDTMKFYTGSTLWRTGMVNGHSNSTLGGTRTNASDIFSARRGQGAPAVYGMGQQMNVGGYIGGSTYGDCYQVYGPNWSTCCIIKNDGWYGGVNPSNVGTCTPGGGDYGRWYGDNAIGGAQGTNSMAHMFTCSKCHSPHAAGLPALLTQNCVDTTLGTPTNNPQDLRAVNCHRKTSTTDGWHKLAPGQ